MESTSEGPKGICLPSSFRVRRENRFTFRNSQYIFNRASNLDLASHDSKEPIACVFVSDGRADAREHGTNQPEVEIAIERVAREPDKNRIPKNKIVTVQVGKFEVSKGALVWYPKDKTYGHKITWSEFNETMKKYPRPERRKK